MGLDLTVLDVLNYTPMKRDGTDKFREAPRLFLKTSRAILGLTQGDFADALGVERWAVANWESGRIIPRATVIIAVKKLVKAHRAKRERDQRDDALSKNRK